MAVKKPSALKPAVTVVVVMLLGLLLSEERPLGRFHWPMAPAGLGWGGARGGDAGAATAPEPEPVEFAPKEARDAIARAPGPQAVLRPAMTDWNALEGGNALTVARRDTAGRVHVTREAGVSVVQTATWRPPKKAGGIKAPRAEDRSARGGVATARSAKGPKAARTTRQRMPRQAYERPERDDDDVEEWDVSEEDASRDDLSEAGVARRVRSWFARFKERRRARQLARGRKVRISLRSLLGKGALRPPSGKLTVPDFAALGPAPKLPKGATEWPRLTPLEIERLRPPDTEAAYRTWYRDVRRNPGHWHTGTAGEYYHRPGAWGLMIEGPKWAWLPKGGNRWWTQGGEAPLVWHSGHWWWKTNDGWFLLHQGKAWGYRFFRDLRRDGLFEPTSGARVIYSLDARLVAVIIPGNVTIVYDLVTGRELGRVAADKD